MSTTPSDTLPPTESGSERLPPLPPSLTTFDFPDDRWGLWLFAVPSMLARR